MTLQAVWPRELHNRRAHVVTLQAEINRLGTGERTPDGAHRLAHLRRELDAAPCPHWDLTPPGPDGTAWQCENCAELVAAEWVPVHAQASAIRRAVPRPSGLLSRQYWPHPLVRADRSDRFCAGRDAPPVVRSA